MTAPGTVPGQAAALPPLPPKWTGKFRVLATVEAVQLVDDLRNHTEVATWIEANGGHAEIPFAEPCLYIETPRGRKRAGIGDWIVRGVTGEFFPVEPDVFEATYEPAGAIAAAAPVPQAAGAREALGRLVRETWVAWAREQPEPKPSWLAGWEELDDGQREVDMRIGEAVARAAKPHWSKMLGPVVLCDHSPAELGVTVSGEPQAAPEIRTCYCGTTATVVPGVFPHDDCDGSVLAQAAPELGGFAEEILGELLQALGDDDDSEPEPGETREHQAIRIVHYLRERLDELHRLIAEPEPLTVKPSDDVKAAPELAAAMAETRRVIDACRPVLDCFTRASDGWRGRISGVVLTRAYKAIGPVPANLKHMEGQ